MNKHKCNALNKLDNESTGFTQIQKPLGYT